MPNRVILGILSGLYLFLCIVCVRENSRRASSKEKWVALPKAMPWIGAVCSLIFLIIAWAAEVEDGSFGLLLCFGFFALLGMFLMLGWKNCMIYYDEDGFTRKNFFGMKRCFTYGEVTAWRLNRSNPMECYLFAAGKKITFNMISDNGTAFFFAVCEGYRRTHGNRALPDQSKELKEKGGFRAHVHNSGEFLGIFIMLVLFIAGCAVFVGVLMIQPLDETDGQAYSVSFSSWSIEEDELVLSAEGMDIPFKVGGYEKYLSHLEELKEKCDGSTVFSVIADSVDPKDGDPYYKVYSMTSEDVVYRSFEDSTAYKREDLPLVMCVFGAILLFILAFAGLMYVVGSHPERFPEWVVYSLFKRNSIDI